MSLEPNAPSDHAVPPTNAGRQDLVPELAPDPWRMDVGGTVETATRPGAGSTMSADRIVALPGVAIVADGVGDRFGSPTAAQVAAASALGALLRAPAITTDAVNDAIHAASRDVELELSSGPSTIWNGATTLTIAAVARHGDGSRSLVVGWVGDSPVAVVSPGADWRWVTRPDGTSLADDPGDSDADGLYDAQVRTRTGRITQALGLDREIAPNVAVVPLPAGSVVVAATDGIVDGGSAASRLLADPDAIGARALADAAAVHGGRDDVAVAVLHPDGRAADAPSPRIAPGASRRWFLFRRTRKVR